MNDDLSLERGLCYYYENQPEFDRKEMPEEKRVAFGFEAGRQFGMCEMCEMKAPVAKVFKPDGREWP